MLTHLNLQQKDVDHVTYVYVYKHHWDWDVLHQSNENGVRYPWNSFIPAEKYRYLYQGTNEVHKEDRNQLYFAPNMSTNKINDKLEQMTLEHDDKRDSSASSINPTATRKFSRDRAQSYALKSLLVKTMKIEKFTQHRKLPRNNASLRNVIDEKDKVIEALHAELAQLRQRNDEMKQLLTTQIVSSYGLTRINITSNKWHLDNRDACKTLFGFRSYDEYKHYFSAFWPEFQITDELPWTQDMSVYEQLTLVKLVFSTDIKLNIVALIYGVTGARVSQIMDKYAPCWGRMGLNLSILTLTDEYLKKVRTQHFIDNGHENCSFGCDGKDFVTEDINSNSAYKRNMYSDKIKSSGFRCIAWNLQNGLTVEHTPLVGARSTEHNILRWWGSHNGVQAVTSPSKSENLKQFQTEESKRKNESDYLHGFRESTPNNKRLKSEGIEDTVYHASVLPSNCHSSKETGKYDRCIYDEQKGIEKNILRDKCSLHEAVRNNSESFLHNYGPDSDMESKQLQLEVLLRLEKLYRGKKLSYCALTHYVHFMKTELQEMLDIVTGKSQKKSQVYFTKLKKFPISTYGICDRGFKQTSMYYPNANRILYPTFLSSAIYQKQFSKGQLTKD